LYAQLLLLEGHRDNDGIHHHQVITETHGVMSILHAGAWSAHDRKTVNQDDPNVYHLFYGDEVASPGADLTSSNTHVRRRRPGAAW